jgi:hypothetical protein
MKRKINLTKGVKKNKIIKRMRTKLKKNYISQLEIKG